MEPKMVPIWVVSLCFKLVNQLLEQREKVAQVWEEQQLCRLKK